MSQTLRDVAPTTKQQAFSTTLTKNAARREKFKLIGQAISSLDIEWRIYRGESPNPWGVVVDAHGFTTQQIISTPRLSHLERRSLNDAPTD